MTDIYWFDDDRQVLVYHPGAGGEYITSVLNEQKLILIDDRNRYKSLNTFPAHDLLYKQASELRPVNQEWSEECRLNFSSELELKEFINKHDPYGEWKFSSGNPTLKMPRLGRRKVIGTNKWFHTHYDYGLFRKPVWKWLDYTNPYWALHWALCIHIKGNSVHKPDTLTRIKATIQRFRRHYNKFPNSRIDVDDPKFRADTNYLEWAQKNIDVVSKFINPDTYHGRFISKEDYEYFLELPK